MNEHWKLIITIVEVTAIPVAAFLIRMYQGNVRNDNEAIISSAVRALVAFYFLGGRERKKQ